MESREAEKIDQAKEVPRGAIRAENRPTLKSLGVVSWSLALLLVAAARTEACGAWRPAAFLGLQAPDSSGPRRPARAQHFRQTSKRVARRQS